MASHCSKCNASVEITFSPEEINYFKSGVADLLVFSCQECGAQLVVNNPFRFPLPLAQITHEIVEYIQHRNMAVFCGAGLSAPSGLPLAKEIINRIIELLELTTDEKEAFLRSGIPFEAFMEVLSEESYCDHLFEIFEGGEPGKGHVLLAKLAKAGFINTIYTTNFDMLFEKALIQEGLIRDENYEVVYQGNQLKTTDLNSSIIRVIKLHGSIEDKKSIRATLHAVATFDFSQQMNHILHSIFCAGPEKAVLILGYSCSDVFDISPQIEQLTASQSRVVLVDHRECSDVWAEELRVRTNHNPFVNFPRGMRVLCDTRTLIDGLWKGFNLPDMPAIPKSSFSNRESCVGMWFSQLTDISNYAIKGILMEKVGLSDNAIDYFERCLELASKKGNRRIETRLHSNLGTLYYQLNEYKHAIDHFMQGMIIAREDGDKQAEVLHLTGLGNVYVRKGQLKEAVNTYRHALEIATELPVIRENLEVLTRLGWALREQGEYTEALSLLKRGLHLARLLGDKNGEFDALKNIGDCSVGLQEYEKAHEYYMEALGIASNVGSIRKKKTALDGLGISCKHLGEYNSAVQYLKESQEISQRLRDPCWVLDANLNLGNVYLKTHEYSKAEGYFLCGLGLAREHNNELSEMKCLNSLGVCYICLKNNRKAIQYFEAALDISNRLFGKDHFNSKGFKKNLDMAREAGN